jgi:2-oxoglutarate dehydrogenase E2 component (dihydrolipoamide succinyltransferase)
MIMSIEIKVPTLPESIADATIVTWHKQVGDFAFQDENIVDLETDKVVLEVPAIADGVLTEILMPEGETVLANQVIGKFEKGAKKAEASAPAVSSDAPAAGSDYHDDLSPAVKRLVQENDVDASAINGTGKGGRITKSDVEAHMSSAKAAAKPAASTPVPLSGDRMEKRVPMTRLRKRIAERLMEAKNNTAMLTTFNEVNLEKVMDLRQQYKDKFEKQNGVRLGFMSFFTKAVVEALKRYPAVNASIDGEDIVYHGFYDVGVAISTDRGLVVPILRDVDQMSMAGIESGIVDYAKRGRAGKLTLEEMTGGTFSITNGGVFGSMLSTPILNAPQSAILGMHTIQQRPVAENGEVVIRPMMYLALSYDHRIVDGKDSIGFLVAIKELLEDPSRFLLGL